MTPYCQIRRHLDSAYRLISWAQADVSFGGEDDLDAADHTKQANEHLDAARELIAEHQPKVCYHRAHYGLLVGLDKDSPTEWVRVWAETAGRHVTVRWAEVAEVPA
uniref:hypothetical protein n=1 Tax=Paractinoplanes polyasparticus TaxID=2856853 RepID=UPI001C850F4F|nr:hypothetical protein [Actinoplanes polyasparticus]